MKMKNVTKALIISCTILFVILNGCLEKEQNHERIELVKFETIAKGYYCMHNEKENYVITNESEWDRLWNEISLDNLSKPKINFAGNITIAVFQGNSSKGYGVKIYKIIEKESVIEIFVKEWYSEKNFSGVTQPIILSRCQE